MENWVEIDLKRLKNNYEYIKKKSASQVCAVIKADGYGVGSYEIAKELEELGVEFFAVAFLKEAIDLRNFGIRSKILILNYVSPEKLNCVDDEGFVFTIYSIEQINIYLRENNFKNLNFHIKINSGMNRLGINDVELNELMDIIKKNSLKITGIYSHFAHVEDEIFTKNQFDKFIYLAKIVESSLNKKLCKHISNSAASLKNREYALDYVRVGMSLYGLQALTTKDNNIKGIITWMSRISAIREVKKGERISYGREEIVEGKKIAIIPVGYSHGYMRQLEKEAYVLIKNQKAKILGKIFMDQMLVDITGIENINISDEVVLLGDGIEAEEIARFSGTIADDVICKISPRIERVFIKE